MSSFGPVPPLPPDPPVDELSFQNAEENLRRRREPEPWFIRFAETVAYVVLFGGLGFATLAFLIGLTWVKDMNHAIALAFMFAVQVAGILFGAAVLLIFVDIARSLRTLCAKR